MTTAATAAAADATDAARSMSPDDGAALHDAVLESIELRWATGVAVLRLRTGDAAHPRRAIVAAAVRHLACPRAQPWGPSASIHHVRGPAPSPDDDGAGALDLELELQSGDRVRLTAAAFALRDDA